MHMLMPVETAAAKKVPEFGKNWEQHEMKLIPLTETASKKDTKAYAEHFFKHPAIAKLAARKGSEQGHLNGHNYVFAGSSPMEISHRVHGGKHIVDVSSDYGSAKATHSNLNHAIAGAVAKHNTAVQGHLADLKKQYHTAKADLKKQYHTAKKDIL